MKVRTKIAGGVVAASLGSMLPGFQPIAADTDKLSLSGHNNFEHAWRDVDGQEQTCLIFSEADLIRNGQSDPDFDYRTMIIISFCTRDIDVTSSMRMEYQDPSGNFQADETLQELGGQPIRVTALSSNAVGKQFEGTAGQFVVSFHFELDGCMSNCSGDFAINPK